MTPRILFVNHTGSLGGGELSLLDIARHFRSSAHVVLFEEGPFQNALHDANVETSILSAPASFQQVSRNGDVWTDLLAGTGSLSLAWRLQQRAREVDVLYANSQKAMIVAALAGWASNTPVIWHLRDLLTDDHFSPLHRRVAITIANLGISCVIANSEATRNAFIDAGGNPHRCHVVHNAISAEAFTPMPDAEKRQLRRDLGIGDVPLVGVFSRLADWKGQHVLVNALTELPDVHALFVGEALFEGDAGYASSLHDRVRSLGLDDRVHFTGFRHDVPRLMQAVDVVAHTSVAPEPFGRVVVEGMLSERPVVATCAGGVPEIIEHEHTGLLVPPNDAPALSAALRCLFSDPAFALEMARNGHNEAVRRFSPDRLFSQVASHLSRVTHIK